EVTIPSRNTESADVGGLASARPAPAARPESPGAVEGRVAGPMVPPPDEPPTTPAEAPAQPADVPPPAAGPPGQPEPVSPSADVAREPAGEEQSSGQPAAAAEQPQPRASGSPAKRRPRDADAAPGAAAPTAGQAGAASEQPTAAAKPAPTAKASAPASDAAPPAPSAGSKGAATKPAKGYSVQVGAFSTDESAQAQAKRVRDAGLPVYTEKIITSQGPRIRVRAGPFGNGEEAERARAKLQLAGIESAILKPSSCPSTNSPAGITWSSSCSGSRSSSDCCEA